MAKLCVWLLITLGFVVHADAQSSSARPNIIFIVSDDHAYQAISAYGGTLIQTPNIDRLALEGAILKNSFVTNSLCAPSRACLLTGKYSHINGQTDNGRPFNTGQQTFSKILRQNNYQTAWIGKWDLQSMPAGFDYWKVLPDQSVYYNPRFINMSNDTVVYNGYVTDLISTFAQDWLDSRDTSKPFCLVIGEKASHRKWLPDLQDLGAFDSAQFPLPSNLFDNHDHRAAAKMQHMTIADAMDLKTDLKVHADFDQKGSDYSFMSAAQRKIFAAYYDGVSREFDKKNLSGKKLTEWKYQRYLKDYLSVVRSLDRNIGYLLDYLDKRHLSKSTIVVYASDQGFFLGEHGWFDKRLIYEESLRTPLVIRYPGVINAGMSVEKFVSNVDWAPTLLDFAHVAVPADMQGKSFASLLRPKGDTAAWRDEVFYHYYESEPPHTVPHHFGIRTTRYKLVRFYKDVSSWELYDLQNDPHEIDNLYDNKKYLTIIDDLKKELMKLAKEYKDSEALGVLLGSD